MGSLIELPNSLIKGECVNNIAEDRHGMNTSIQIRPVHPDDASTWEQMRRELWPQSPEDHPKEIALFFEGTLAEPVHVFMAFTDTGEPVGFAELSIRNYAEGCSTNRVAYLEGWFVVAEYRGRGVGTALLKAAEAWGRTQGCTEIASDAEIENAISITAHRALGFSETARLVCYRKTL